MQKLSKFILLPLVAALLFSGAFALADDSTDEVTPGDLGITRPILLPDSPLYFLKEWGRTIQSFFAFGQLKKAELEQHFADERLAELQVLVDEGKLDSSVLEKATAKYNKTMAKIQKHVGQIEETAEEDEDVSKFLDKFAKHQLLHEKILEKLQGLVPEDVFETINQARVQHLERFQEVMQKLEQNQERIAERVQNALENDGEISNEIRGKFNQIKAKFRGDSGCRNMWWFDNDNETCQQKQFCGAYMYLGLQTFENQEDCQEALAGIEDEE